MYLLYNAISLLHADTYMETLILHADTFTDFTYEYFVC